MVGSQVSKLRIIWKKSAIGYAKEQKMTIRALGFRSLNQAIIQEDSPAVRGMINKVRHLVHVEEVAEE